MAALLLSSCIAEPVSPLRVGYSVWPGYEGLYLAGDLGYYQKDTVRLIDYPSNSEIIRALRNHDLDFGTLTMYEALLLAETHPKIKVILVMDSSHGADVILGEANIKTLQDAKDKRIGVEAGALGAFVLTRAFEQSGLNLEGVKLVSLGVSEHEEAFNNRLVDAIVTYEPTRSKLLAKGANLLFDSTKLPGEILDVLVVQEDVIQQRPEAINKIISGYFKAWQYLEHNPQDAAKRIAPREGVTPQDFLESLKGLHILTLQENQQILNKTDITSQQRFQKVSDFMIQRQLLRSPKNLTSLFDDQFVQQ
jgi:NitT/TauT family transport system substrate-binding protein